jgi:hypothetical protein
MVGVSTEKGFFILLFENFNKTESKEKRYECIGYIQRNKTFGVHKTLGVY